MKKIEVLMKISKYHNKNGIIYHVVSSNIEEKMKNVPEEKKLLTIAKNWDKKYVQKYVQKNNIKVPKIYFEFWDNIYYLSFREKLGKRVSFKLYNNLKGKLEDAFSGFDSGYSMGERIDITIEKVLISRIDKAFYYRGSRYKAKHGYEKVDLTLAEAKKLQIIKGIPTVIKKSGKAVWWEEHGYKSRWEIRRVEGYIYKDVHSTISVRDAKKTYIRRERKKRGKMPKALLRRIIGIEHIREAGACDAGINAFLRRVGIDQEEIGGIRVDYLLELAEKNNQKNLLMQYLQAVDI